ncbi:hypothetical protein HDV02_002387 [Globomyces sp. JEL0801]|nr:hypothetical protein HDV02_002387 [Globomyces sp. JEL0801]
MILLGESLYGLDADLIMLGLLSHEPHFSLLREEVTFGRSKKSITTAGNQTFFLLHLSLLREYLSYEFNGLEGVLPFHYDFENILDDFILLSIFVGNDFLPHLPGLHINEGAFIRIFEIYKEILPTCDGYLNNNGQLNLPACQKFFSRLGELELEEFKSVQGDISWMKSKSQTPSKNVDKKKKWLTSKQFEYLNKIGGFCDQPRDGSRIELNWGKIPAKDRKFIIELLTSLGLDYTIDAHQTKGGSYMSIGWNDDDDESDEESCDARSRILRKYQQWEVLDEEESSLKLQADIDAKFATDFDNWKLDYYKEKLELNVGDTAFVPKIVYSYMEGLQWVLLYYYHGVPSWEWFYSYHYSPRITDFNNIVSYEFEFRLGTPFFPFEQLMAVLPPYSRQHVPPSLQDLMIDIHSPIIDFYPVEFELDMNGKRADWEAIVKIPFIDEVRLLKAVKSRKHMLTPEESARNARGDTLKFTFKSIKSNKTGIAQPHCKVEIFSQIPKGRSTVVNKLCSGAYTGIDLRPGFPSLDTIPHTVTIGYHGVNIFNTDSKNPSIGFVIQNAFDNMIPEDIAACLIGRWPYLLESRVISLSDELFVYKSVKNKNIKVPHNEDTLAKFIDSSDRSEKYYNKRCGVMIGPIEMLAHVETLVGMKLLNDGSFVKEFVENNDYDLAIQTIVCADHEDPRYKTRPPPPIKVEFPLGSKVFFLSPKLYGIIAEVIGHNDASSDTINIRIMRASEGFQSEVSSPKAIAKQEMSHSKYIPGWEIAKRLKMSSFALSKLSSNLHVKTNGSEQRVNLGLCLKFDQKNRKVLGYTEKSASGWLYSDKAIELFLAYKSRFPMILKALETPPKEDFYNDYELFGEGDNRKNIQSAIEFLKEYKIKELPTVPLSAEVLSKDAVRSIETELDTYSQLLAETPLEAIDIKGVPRKNVLKPSHSKFRLMDQDFSLGDRVIMTLDQGDIPLGEKGVVVGIDGESLDIIFDHVILGGSTLDDRCSEGRGAVCTKLSMLNLTNIRPPYAVNASRKPEPISQPKYRNSSQPAPNKWQKGPPTAESHQTRGYHGNKDHQRDTRKFQNSPQRSGPSSNHGIRGKNDHERTEAPITVRSDKNAPKKPIVVKKVNPNMATQQVTPEQQMEDMLKKMLNIGKNSGSQGPSSEHN